LNTLIVKNTFPNKSDIASHTSTKTS